MNRPIGFDLADLTADDRRAIRTAARNERAVFANIDRFNRAVFAAEAAKRRRQQQTRDALVTAAKVAGGALGCIAFVAYLAVFLGV